MNPQVKQLLSLQEADQQILSLQEEMKRYPELRKAREAEVHRAEEDLESAREEMKSLELRVREMESRVRGWRDDLGRFGAQQERVKSQKEYDALTKEIDETQAKIADADGQGLEALEEEDRLTQRIEELQHRLETRRKACQEDLARLSERLEDKKGLKERFEAERSRLRAGIDPKLLAQYDKLCERYPGNALASVDGGNCGGCHIRILARQIQEIARSGMVAPCDSCKRLLYMPNPAGV